MDNKLTLDMQGWLDTEPALRDLQAGALMVLQLNRNRFMYHQAMAAPQRMAGKIEYEMRKYLKMRLDNMTADAVAHMEAEAVPDSYALRVDMKERLGEDEQKHAKGMRPDHEVLPDEIKALWDLNREQYHKLKQVHEDLKQMEDAQPCDRYELLKVLVELDKSIRRTMAAYDGYDQSKPAAEEPQELEPAELVKKISAARTYISDNKVKLKELLDKQDPGAPVLADKINERVQFLLSTGNALADATMQELVELGIDVSA